MARLVVRLTPKAALDRIEGWDVDGQGRSYLKVRVTAPPVEGRANQAMTDFVAKALNIPKSHVSLIGGDTSRLKTLEIDGLSDVELKARLG